MFYLNLANTRILYIHTHTHTRMHTCTYTHTHTCMHTCTYVHTHTHARTSTHTYTSGYKHTRAHTEVVITLLQTHRNLLSTLHSHTNYGFHPKLKWYKRDVVCSLQFYHTIHEAFDTKYHIHTYSTCDPWCTYCT